MIRPATVCLLLFGACLCSAQLEGEAFSKSIAFRQGATRVPAILDALSKETGIPLKASPYFENEVLVVSVKERPIREVLGKLADAVSGQWRFEGGAYLLARDLKKTQEEERESNARRVEQVKELQAGAREMLAKDFSPQTLEDAARQREDLETKMQGRIDYEVWRKYEQLANLGPFQRAAMRLLVGIDPKILAGIGPRDRVVFSTSPTSMQRPIGGHATAAIEQLIGEQRLWADVQAQMPGDDERRMFVGSFETPRKAFKKPIGKVLFIANRSAWSDDVDFSMLVVDVDGKAVGRVDLQEDSLRRHVPEERKTENESRDPIGLSEASKRFTDLASARMTGIGSKSAWQQPARDLVELLLQPEKVDPLSFILSDVLLQLADRKKMDLMAVANDADLLWMSTVGTKNKGLTVGTAEKMFGETLKYDDSSGWMTVRPADPYQARLDRLDRHAMGGLFRAIDKEGRLSLDSIASYLLKSRGPNVFVTQMICRLLDPQVVADFWQKGDEDALRLYATLTPIQRQALRGGQKLAYGSLSPQQQALVRRLTYGSDVNVTSSASFEVEPTESDLSDFVGIEGLSAEPTELLPRGIPAATQVSLTAGQTMVLYAYDGTEDGPLAFGEELESIATQLYFKEHPELFPWAQDNPSLDLFRAARRNSQTLTLTYGPTVTAQYSLADDTMLTQGAPIRRDQLPKEFLDALAAEMKKVAEMYKGFKPGATGTDDPPPPPPSR
jgi:hypothetical protein